MVAFEFGDRHIEVEAARLVHISCQMFLCITPPDDIGKWMLWSSLPSLQKHCRIAQGLRAELRMHTHELAWKKHLRSPISFLGNNL